ncbi:hypothetical protein K7432_001308 [Basidiobolus ranarum]|uniref:Zn(2)-C6 fungal-type domain-containing protein n=1 Tax=Basidiobolus ranarum TaxID=34480 RepID=A0ABR2X389_9FUNG
MNPQDALDSSKPIKRKRLTQACDICRKKKVKCDGNRPSCSNCIRLNVTCTYLPSFKKRGPRQGPTATEETFTGSSVEFFRRLSTPGSTQINNIKQPNTPLRASSLPDIKPISSIAPVSSLPTAPTNYFSNFSHIPIPSFDAGGTPFFGNVNSQILPVYSPHYSNQSPKKETKEKDTMDGEIAVREKVEQVWSQSYLGNTSGLHSLTGGGKEKTPSPKSESEVLCLVGADSLPPPQITEHLANLYFDVIYPQMPFVHRPTFFRKLKNKEIPPILILSICACVSRLSNHPAILADESTRRGEVFSERFRDILVLCLDDPCLSTIQALLIFSYYEYTNARISRSWMYLGMAVRMAQELGINRIDEGGLIEDQCPSEWVEAETSRRVWWSCFIRDRLVSSGTGRSMAIDEQDTRVLLPCDENDFNNENPVETELLDISDNAANGYSVSSSLHPYVNEKGIGYRAHWVKLVALLGRVSQFVNSPQFRKTRSSPETLAKFATLENSLAAWAESLPSQYKYPCNLVTESSPSAYARAGFIICIHILYHAVIILLYRSNLDKITQQTKGEFTDTLVGDSWKRCITSANEITAAIPDFYTYPSCYNYPHISFGIFTAGTVYMHSLFSSNVTTAVEEAKSKLDNTYQTLLMLKKEWPMAGKYGILLKGLVSVRNRVATQDKSSVCKLENPSLSITPPPEFGLENFNLSAPETQFDSTSSNLDSIYESPQVDESGFDFFNGFQDLVDMPFSQGGSFLDGLLSNMYTSSGADSSVNSSHLPLDMNNIACGFNPEEPLVNELNLPVTQAWAGHLTNSF